MEHKRTMKKRDYSGEIKMAEMYLDSIKSVKVKGKIIKIKPNVICPICGSKIAVYKHYKFPSLNKLK